MTIVVDASAVAAILFAEPNAGDLAERLAGNPLVAPPLLSFELANICVVKCRRAPEQAAALIAAFNLRDGLDIEELPVDQNRVVRLALETKLSAYDASYLRLALDLDADLVTLDKALARAWEALAKRDERRF